MVLPSSKPPPSLGICLVECCLGKPAQYSAIMISSASDPRRHSRQGLLHVTNASDGSPWVETTQQTSGLVFPVVLTFPSV